MIVSYLKIFHFHKFTQELSFLSGSIHNVSDASHIKFSILTVSPLTPLFPGSLFFLLHNKHTSQSFCSLTLRLCRLSEQSQEKSRESKRGKEEGTVGGERERGVRVLSKSLFSGSPKQKDDTDMEGLFHVLGAESERDEPHHIPSVFLLQNLAVHLFHN